MTRKGSRAGRTSDRAYAPRVGNQTEHRNYKFVDIFDPLPWAIPALKSTDPVILLVGSRGGGKAESIENEIPTPSGFTKMKDIKVGDFVFGSDGKPTEVIATTDIMHDRDCYNVEFSNGAIVRCDKSHLWPVNIKAPPRPGHVTITTARIKNILEFTKLLYTIQPGLEIVSVAQTESVPVKCITVKNEDGIYLTSKSFIPTHNSMHAAQKIHGFCLRYPGATALVVRKSRTSMFNSTVAFMKTKVLGRYLRNGWVQYKSTERRFEYQNGSVIILEGMSSDDQRENIRSAGQEGGIDIAWMEEAIQFDEEDYNEILGGMRGNAAPWRQMILSTNPDSPTHWIYQRLILGGEARKFESSAVDNHHNPADYIKRLDSLPVGSVERARLRDGRWAQAGGVVLDAWKDNYDNAGNDAGGNVTTKADYIPDGGPILWWVDDGYAGELDPKSKMFKAGSHPRVFLLAQLRGDGRLAVFAESYAVKKLAPDHIKEVIAMHARNRWPKPSRVIYDKAAASLGGHLRAELAQAWGMPASDIVYNAVPVDQGNSELNTRVAPDENDVRMVIVHPRCKYLRLEAVSYKINPKTGKRVKDFDHGPDAMRLGVWDYIYGGPAEVDVASIDDVELPEEYYDDLNAMDEDGITTYDMGVASVAAII